MVNINTACVAMVSVYQYITILANTQLQSLKKKKYNNITTIQKFDTSCQLNF